LYIKLSMIYGPTVNITHTLCGAGRLVAIAFGPISTWPAS